MGTREFDGRVICAERLIQDGQIEAIGRHLSVTSRRAARRQRPAGATGGH
jgi:hypothetical protein